MPAGSVRRSAERSGISCVRRAVPPAPPTNRRAPAAPAARASSRAPVLGTRAPADPGTAGNPRVPESTTVGSPLSTRQPGIVTASQPCTEVAPTWALPLAIRFVPAGATMLVATSSLELVPEPVASTTTTTATATSRSAPKPSSAGRRVNAQAPLSVNGPWSAQPAHSRPRRRVAGVQLVYEGRSRQVAQSVRPEDNQEPAA